jgi:FixJ family two-component response regulator
MTKPTVFIIDDDASARRGLTRLVGALGLDVESFASANSFLAAGRHAEPGCIVLDVKMPEMTGPVLQEELAKTGHHMPIIFVSAYGDVPTTARTMKMGAIDFLTKPVDRDSLLEAITEALAIDAKNRAFQAEKAMIHAHLDTLTPREYEVMTYVIAGLLNKQIARELDISEITVKTHRGRVMRKLGTDSLVELVRLCEKAGVSPTSSAT